MTLGREMYETRSDLARHAPREVLRFRALLEASLLVARVITHAISLEEAAPKLLEELAETMGWDAAILWRLDRTTEQLVPVGTWQADSLPRSQLVDRSRAMAFKRAQGLPGRALESGKPVWILREREEPWFFRFPEAKNDGLQSGLAFPMRAGNDVIGVIELFAREPKAPDRELLEAIGELASPIGSIMAHARSEEVQRLLDDASTTLFGSLDLTESLGRFASLCVPGFADVCTVRCLTDDGFVDPVAAAHVDAAELEKIRAWDRKYRLRPVGVLGEVVHGGRSILYESIDPEAACVNVSPDERENYIYEHKLSSAMLLPLQARGHALGMFVLATTGTRRYSRGDLAIAEELARRASLAIDNARLFESERKARAQAEAATQAKDEFLAVLSHELRTPLQSMLGWTQMLRGRRLDDEAAARGLAAIERATRTQAQLIGDLLDVSRIVAGKLSLDAQRIALVPIIDAAIESMRTAAEAKSIRIERSFACPSVEISGDSYRLQQIMTNLLSNAIKFTGKGGQIVVRLAREGSSACITVEDDGIGISADFLPHIFDRFRQADSTSRRAHGGLGLGLTIVRHLVELHGGTVTATSEGEGKGARFDICLPRAFPIDDGDAEAPPDSVDMRGLPRLDGLRVLVVDDDAETCELIRTLLGSCGAEVLAVESTARALDSIATAPPDLLISDVRMPDEDGYSFIRRVRALGQARGGSIPAIALTADATGAAHDHALAAGFQHHIAKPVHPLHLARVIASLRDGAGRK